MKKIVLLAFIFSAWKLLAGGPQEVAIVKNLPYKKAIIRTEFHADFLINSPERCKEIREIAQENSPELSESELNAALDSDNMFKTADAVIKKFGIEIDECITQHSELFNLLSQEPFCTGEFKTRYKNKRVKTAIHWKFIVDNHKNLDKTLLDQLETQQKKIMQKFNFDMSTNMAKYLVLFDLRKKNFIACTFKTGIKPVDSID